MEFSFFYSLWFSKSQQNIISWTFNFFILVILSFCFNFFVFYFDHASCSIIGIFYLRNAIHFVSVFLLHWSLLKIFTMPFPPFFVLFLNTKCFSNGSRSLWICCIHIIRRYGRETPPSSCLLPNFQLEIHPYFFTILSPFFYSFFSFFLTFVLSFLNNNHIFLWLIVKMYIDLDKNLVINHYYRNIYNHLL